jgi:GTPase SAR1 family protein
VEEEQLVVRALVCGEAHVGKTQLIQALWNEEFSLCYEATVEPSVRHMRLPLSFRVVELELWDVGSKRKVDPQRKILYETVQTVMVCFSLTDPASWDQAKKTWLPPLFGLATPPEELTLLLVGCKEDNIDVSQVSQNRER